MCTQPGVGGVQFVWVVFITAENGWRDTLYMWLPSPQDGALHKKDAPTTSGPIPPTPGSWAPSFTRASMIVLVSVALHPTTSGTPNPPLTTQQPTNTTPRTTVCQCRAAWDAVGFRSKQLACMRGPLNAYQPPCWHRCVAACHYTLPDPFLLVL